MRQAKKLTAHMISEGFRRWMWDRFWAESKRHELGQLAKNHGIKAYNTVRVKKTREMMSDSVMAAICMGAIRSPGNFDAYEQAPFTSKCIACDAVGYHNHVFWDCPKVEEKFGPRPKASDPWQRRSGWPLARKDTKTR